MNSINIHFTQPLFLLLLIPAVILMLWPYFRLPKQHRRTRNRIVSMVLHSVVLVLTTLVLAGISLEVSYVDIKHDVMIVVDKSKSNESAVPRMNEFISDIIDELPSGYRVGIVEFANGNVYSATLSGDKASAYQSYLNQVQNPSTNGTDIAGALSYAHQALENPQGGRIILLSDGRETDGRALVASSSIGNTGTRIDVVYFGNAMSDTEVQIVDVKVPDFVSLGAMITISVTVQSAQPGTAVIHLTDNDQPIGNDGGHPVTLSGGLDTFIFDYSFSVARLHEIKTVVESEDDDVTENNTWYSYVFIEGSSNRILIIDGTGNESATLADFLGNDYSVEVVNVNEIQVGNYGFINMFDEIIMMNVANADLPNGFADALKNYVEVIGGGLLTTGGDKAYQQNDMEGTTFESILPVFASTNAKPLAVMVVIDASTSMTNGGSQRLNLAKQGAIAALNALSDQDVMGVIMFNTNATVMIAPTVAANKVPIINAINNIQSALGTRYTEGLQYAKNQLDTFPGNANFNKHIIFLTDGEPTDAGYMAVIASLGSISLSAFAIEPANDTFRQNTQALVRVVEDRGAFYDVSNAQDLPAFMAEDTLASSSGYFNEIPFIPTIDTRTPALGELIDLPELGGYYGTRLKDGATQVLAKESDPVYAEWSYGNGRVGSFTSDLNGDWSTDFFNDVRGHIFIRNTIDELLPNVPVNHTDLSIQFTKQNFQSQVRVVNLNADEARIYATIKNPNGQETTFELSKQTNQIFGGLFRTGVPGVYEIKITKQNMLGQQVSERTTYTTFSYSEEYNGFYDDVAMFEKMGEIAKNGNGQVLFGTENMFSNEAQTTITEEDPTLAFMIIALVLFLIDIIVRKFKFKWPHEIWQSIKSKRELNS